MKYIKILLNDIIKENLINIVFALVCTLVITLLNFSIPQIQKIIIDNFIINGNYNLVIYSVVIIILIALMIYIFQGISEKIILKIQQVFVNNSRYRFINIITKMPGDLLENYEISELQVRFNELNKMSNLFSSNIFSLLTSAILMVFSIFYLSSLHYSIVIFLLMLLPMHYVINKNSLNQVNDNSNLVFNENIKISKEFSGFSKNIHFLKSNFIIKDQSSKLLYNINEFSHTQNKFRKSMVYARLLIHLCVRCTNAFFILILGKLAIENKITIGEYFISFQYINYFFQPITILSTTSISIVPSFVIFKKYVDFCHEYEEVSEDDKKLQLKQIDNLQVIKPNFENRVQKEYIFTLFKEQSYKLKGSNGNGKSTILKLIHKKYNLDSGKIKINGINIKEYSENSLWNNCYYVEQEIPLFSGTVWDNIALNKKITFSNLKTKLKEDGLEELLNGIDILKIINCDGKNLSLGQRKKIGLLRLYLEDKSLYLIDELGASMDINTIQLLRKIIDTKKKNAIIIEVEHNWIKD